MVSTHSFGLKICLKYNEHPAFWLQKGCVPRFIYPFPDGKWNGHVFYNNLCFSEKDLLLHSFENLPILSHLLIQSIIKAIF